MMTRASRCPRNRGGIDTALALAASALLVACGGADAPGADPTADATNDAPAASTSPDATPAHNALTDPEIADGWMLLFDGETTE